MISSEFRQYLKKKHKFDNRLNYITAIIIILIALHSLIDFFLDDGGSNSLKDDLGLSIFIVFFIGLGAYIIWETYIQYKVQEYYSTVPKEEKLRIIKEYLDQMWRYSEQENDEINITHYSYRKKSIYESINLVLYIDDSKLIFNAYYSRCYVLDLGRRRRATKNLRTFLKAHL